MRQAFVQVSVRLVHADCDLNSEHLRCLAQPTIMDVTVLDAAGKQSVSLPRSVREACSRARHTRYGLGIVCLKDSLNVTIVLLQALWRPVQLHESSYSCKNAAMLLVKVSTTVPPNTICGNS